MVTALNNDNHQNINVNENLKLRKCANSESIEAFYLLI
ncbi:hypothetical protein ZONE111904_12535 [Zobellia nedashkovskayae]